MIIIALYLYQFNCRTYRLEGPVSGAIAPQYSATKHYQYAVPTNNFTAFTDP